MCRNGSSLRCLWHSAVALLLFAGACTGEIGSDTQFQVGADASPVDASTLVIDAAAEPPDVDAPLPEPCDDGDLQAEGAGGSCYWAVHTTPVDWTTARVACQADGGDLAIITSLAESDEVNALAIAALTASADEVVDYWIGASDSATEGAFLWPDGTPLGFSNWRLNEPNDGGVAGEDCTIIEADRGGSWDDRACDNGIDPPVTVNYGYICER